MECTHRIAWQGRAGLYFICGSKYLNSIVLLPEGVKMITLAKEKCTGIAKFVLILKKKNR